jgi:hypothetical protein
MNEIRIIKLFKLAIFFIPLKMKQKKKLYPKVRIFRGAKFFDYKARIKIMQ